MSGATKGCKVFTTVREFEIDDSYESFRGTFTRAKQENRLTVSAELQGLPITFNIDSIGAFIPMIDLSGRV